MNLYYVEDRSKGHGKYVIAHDFEDAKIRSHYSNVASVKILQSDIIDDK